MRTLRAMASFLKALVAFLGALVAAVAVLVIAVVVWPFAAPAVVVFGAAAAVYGIWVVAAPALELAGDRRQANLPFRSFKKVWALGWALVGDSFSLWIIHDNTEQAFNDLFRDRAPVEVALPVFEFSF